MSRHTLTDTRALAAQSLAEVALRGASSREVFERAAPQLADARDRAFLGALLFEGARWWLRFDAALDGLLKQPLRRKEPVVHALLVLGLVQIEVLGMPAYAAVGATVEAVRALRRPRHAGLVNAVLRRWLRERDTRLAALDGAAQTRHAQPRWLIDAIAADWPQQAQAVLAAANREPPLMLRVNRRRGTREALIAALADTGHAAAAHAWLSDAVVLEKSTEVTRLPGFSEGLFAVQDGAAQIAADLLDLVPGQRVLDACAAPGGKACHALEREEIQLLAVESAAHRIARIRGNFHRLGLHAEVVHGDAGAPAAWSAQRQFDRILVDAPCSATGVMRRRPDVRLHRRAGDIAPLVAEQRRLLGALWPLLVPGGRLLYVTCSLLRAENADVIAAFLGEHTDARVRPFDLPAGHAATPGWQILPGEDDLDGMYYAVLEKS